MTVRNRTERISGVLSNNFSIYPTPAGLYDVQWKYEGKVDFKLHETRFIIQIAKVRNPNKGKKSEIQVQLFDLLSECYSRD